jgi:hypothetical protein
MKNYLSHYILTLGLISGINISAQVTTSFGNESTTFIKKGAEHLNLSAGGNQYFFTTFFEQATKQFYLECFNASGQTLAQNKLAISVGVFNNSYSISEVIALGNNVYAMVEHLDKPSGKNSFSARIVSSSGEVSTDENVLLTMPFEKTMNSGYNHAAVSPDQSTLAVIGELPFVKEEAAKVKIALYDVNLNETASHNISLDGILTKNRNIETYVANDGTVYLLVRTFTKNGEISLQVFQVNTDGAMKHYAIETEVPDYITTYTATTTPNNELIVAGTTYKRTTVSVNEKMANGLFYFTNKGKSEQRFIFSPFDQPVENLTARKLLINGTTTFLTAEIFKEEKVAPPAGTGAASFEYSYVYSHKNEYMFGFDADGVKKFELNAAKEFNARDFNKPYLAGYFIVDGKLTVVYNDYSRKYTQLYSNNTIVPVIVTVTNDGMLSSPIVLMDNSKLPYNYLLYPCVNTQVGSTMMFLMKNNEKSQFVSMKLK